MKNKAFRAGVDLYMEKNAMEKEAILPALLTGYGVYKGARGLYDLAEGAYNKFNKAKGLYDQGRGWWDIAKETFMPGGGGQLKPGGNVNWTPPTEGGQTGGQSGGIPLGNMGPFSINWNRPMSGGKGQQQRGNQVNWGQLIAPFMQNILQQGYGNFGGYGRYQQPGYQSRWRGYYQ